MQSKSDNRTDNRTLEKRFPYGTKLPWGQKRHTNKRSMATTAWNLKKLMEKLIENFLNPFYNYYPQKNKLYQCGLNVLLKNNY